MTDTIGAGLTLPLTIVYFTITTDVPLAVLGAVSTVATLVALPIGLVGGVLTDRFGAKASMILNNLLSAAGFTLYLFAHDPMMIFAAIFLANGSERLYWTSWTAYVHDLAEGRPFERWFAFLEGTKAAALGAGAIIAAVTLANGHQDGLRWLILANVVTSVLAAGVFATQPTGHRSTPPSAPSCQVREHRDPTSPHGFAERVVRSQVVQYGPTVAHHDDVERVHQMLGSQRRADRDVELRAELAGEVDVLVAVASALRLVPEVTHVEDAKALVLSVHASAPSAGDGPDARPSISRRQPGASGPCSVRIRISGSERVGTGGDGEGSGHSGRPAPRLV
ncbi:MFS transporter [Curtobacterium flaccumfaciens]|uniref:MFS transporter n=1 Tax=Curtobacterium flaccumfaciens TaxID=2035 RepID=UPI0024A955E2|nr:MFS transporter [Curtobacterium flaccumfaciens]